MCFFCSLSLKRSRRLTATNVVGKRENARLDEANRSRNWKQFRKRGGGLMTRLVWSSVTIRGGRPGQSFEVRFCEIEKKKNGKFLFKPRASVTTTVGYYIYYD